MKCLSPSILAADFGNLAAQVQQADEAGAAYIHFDVMDGMFVPSISFGLPVLKSLRGYTDKILDVHLMVTEPGRYVQDFVDAGADIITVHAEACTHLDRVLYSIKQAGIMAGVAINPATPVETIKHVLPIVDMVLVMTVNPGFGGQKLIDYTLDKVREVDALAKKSNLKIDIEVDGGITLDNIDEALAAGANVIVAGSAVFNGNITENVTKLLDKMA